MTFNELYNSLNQLYPVSLRCEWDNDGIMCVDNGEREVKRVLISLDVTMDVVNYAIENGYDTIISHHPLVFRSQKALTPVSFTQNKLIQLIKSGIGVMSFHTRLDAAKNGVNDTLASVLGIEGVVVDELDPIGRIGYLPCKMEPSAFAKNVKESLNSRQVIRQNKEFPDRPVIRIIKDKDGMEPAEERIKNLVQVHNVFIEKVLE